MNHEMGSCGPEQMGQACDTQQQRDGMKIAGSDFGEKQMEAFCALQYHRPADELLLRQGRDIGSAFRRMQLAMAFPQAVQYDAVMRMHDGNPCYVEFRHRECAKWAFVLPDVNAHEVFRVQFFDERGMICHQTEGKLERAVAAMVREGYVVEDRGAADRLSSTNEWKQGTEKMALLQRLNSGQITHDEFMKQQMHMGL